MVVLGESNFGSASALSSVDHNGKNWKTRAEAEPV